MLEIKIIYEEINNLPKIKYVFDFIFKLPICKEKFNLKYMHIDDYHSNINGEIIINYGETIIDEALNCKPQKWFLDNYKTSKKHIKSLVYNYKNKKLYGIGFEQFSNKFHENNIINLDIVQTFFFHLSRIEEYYALPEQLDHHERMKSDEQFLVKNNIYRRPVLDDIAFSFLQILGIEKSIKTKKIMSHDIDVIEKYPNFYKFLRGMLRILFKKKKYKGSFFLYVKWYLLVKLKIKKDPYDTFDWLFSHDNIKEKYVYFMAGGLTKYDNLYSIKNKKIKKYIKRAKENNYELGLHPSYLAYKNEELFIKEKRLLEKISGNKIINSRQHILHFDFKETIDILENNGIKIDSTLGYQDKIGFRCGTGFTYYLWDFKNNQQRKIKERPLIIMDGCLLIEAKYKVSNAKEIYYCFLKENEYNTQITFNFHNSIFDPVLLNKIELKKLFFKL